MNVKSLNWQASIITNWLVYYHLKDWDCKYLGELQVDVYPNKNLCYSDETCTMKRHTSFIQWCHYNNTNSSYADIWLLFYLQFSHNNWKKAEDQTPTDSALLS